MSRSVLDEIIDGVRADLAERQAATPIEDLKGEALRAPEALDPMLREVTGNDVMPEHALAFLQGQNACEQL